MYYDPSKTTFGATNPHKVLEYLASGNPVRTIRIATYVDSNLIVLPETCSTASMPDLLAQQSAQIDVLQASERRRDRAQLALSHTYAANIVSIDSLARAAMTGVKEAA